MNAGSICGGQPRCGTADHSHSSERSSGRIDRRPAFRPTVSRAPSSSCVVVAAGLWCCLLAGCWGSSAASVEAARQHLQLGKPQEAIDALSEATSAEALYLKSIALYRLELPDAADQELANAVSKDARNPKYSGFQLRMQMLQGQTPEKRAEQIVELFQKHPASSPVALFAASAYAILEKPEEALQAFKTSVALSDEAPEFLPEMLNFAQRAHLASEAETILDKLVKLAPDDPVVVRQKIAVLILLQKSEAAITEARKLYEADHGDSEALLLYARALGTAKASPETDRALEELAREHPQNHELVVLYTTYLARSKRMSLAVQTINGLITKLPPRGRMQFMHLAISLPLEAEEADIAERQLQLYRTALNDPLFVSYYEGRVLVARRDLPAAAAKFAAVVEGGKTNQKGARILAAEAAMWLGRIEAEKRVINQFEKAAKRGQTSADEAAKKTSGDEKTSDTRKPPETPKKPEAKPADRE